MNRDVDSVLNSRSLIIECAITLIEFEYLAAMKTSSYLNDNSLTESKIVLIDFVRLIVLPGEVLIWLNNAKTDCFIKA